VSASALPGRGSSLNLFSFDLPFFPFFSFPFFSLRIGRHHGNDTANHRHVRDNKCRDRHRALHTEGHLPFTHPTNHHLTPNETTLSATLTVFNHRRYRRRSHPPSHSYLDLPFILVFYLSFRWSCFRRLCCHQQVLAAEHGHRDQRSHRSGGIRWSCSVWELEGCSGCRCLVAQPNENFRISFPHSRCRPSHPLRNFDAQRQYGFPSLPLLPVGAKRAALTDLPHPYPFPYDIQPLLHFTLPILRILLLVILFFAFANPVVTYTKVTSADDVLEDPPMSTTPLLSSSHAHEYVNHQSGLGLTVRDNNYGACENGTYSPTTERAQSLEGPEDVSDRIKVRPRIALL